VSVIDSICDVAGGDAVANGVDLLDFDLRTQVVDISFELLVEIRV
jgi:hypothetical protein